jgi:predicted dehydrogenase
VTDRLRIAVLGVGRRGREHLETIATLPERFELVAICDPSEKALAAAPGQVAGYADPAELLHEQRPDVVVIATPPDTHYLMARLAADAGVHMLVETPLALTLAQMNELCEAVARAGVKSEAGENMWRRPADRLTKQVLDAGLIGKILRISSYYDDAAENCPYHTMSRMRRYAGSDPVEIRAFARTFAGIAPIVKPNETVTEESWTQAELTFANGVLGSCTYVTNWTRPLRAGHPRFFSIEGTAGFIVSGLGAPNVLRRVENGTAIDYPLRIETQRVGDADVPDRFFYATDPPIEFQNPYADRVLDRGTSTDGISRAMELDALYLSITADAATGYSLEQARRDQELAILINEAAESGEPIALPTAGGTSGARPLA